MTAIPTPPKKQYKKVEHNRPEHLSHMPLKDHQGLNDLRDRLEFAPRGEEHNKR